MCIRSFCFLCSSIVVQWCCSWKHCMSRQTLLVLTVFVIESSGVACFLFDFPQTLKLFFSVASWENISFSALFPLSERRYRLNSHQSQFRNGSSGFYGQNIDVTWLWGVLCSCDFNWIFRHSCLCLNMLVGRLIVNHAVLNCTLVCVSLEQGCCVLLLAVSLMANGLAIWVRPHFPAPFVAHLCGGPVKGVKVCYCKCDQHHRERLSCFFCLKQNAFVSCRIQAFL